MTGCVTGAQARPTYRISRVKRLSCSAQRIGAIKRKH